MNCPSSDSHYQNQNETYEQYLKRMQYKMQNQLGLSTYLNKKEIKLLYDFIKHQHISYENIELIETVRKIARIIDEES